MKTLNRLLPPDIACPPPAVRTDASECPRNATTGL